MAKVTQKQLIEQIKLLKEIKPRKEWAALLKSQLLAEKETGTIATKNPARFASVFSSIFTQKKLAYAFAAILLVIVGAFGFTKLFPSGSPSTQTASLTGSSAPKQVADLDNKISALAQATKGGSATAGDINTKVSALAKSLKNTQVKDPQVIKEIAKTLADVPGTDLTSNSDPDVKDLYQTVVLSQITDLQKATLTDAQKAVLTQAQDLYNQGKYEQALEEILPISN